jgi:hypothetical protein
MWVPRFSTDSRRLFAHIGSTSAPAAPGFATFGSIFDPLIFLLPCYLAPSARNQLINVGHLLLNDRFAHQPKLGDVQFHLSIFAHNQNENTVTVLDF